LELVDKVKGVADDAELLENHARLDLLLHLDLCLCQLLLLSLALRRWGRGGCFGELALDQIPAFFATRRHKVLQSHELLVDLFSSAPLDHRMVGLASQHPRFASAAIFVECRLLLGRTGCQLGDRIRGRRLA
jgi:hypothetical protein